MALLHEALTFELRKCMIELHNEIRVGFDEETYHQGLIRKLTKTGIPFVSKQKRRLTHRGKKIKTFELDFLADDKVIIELKCLRSGFLRSNYVQILSYLKLWQKDLGLLVNWGLPRLKFKRLPFTEKPLKINEDYSYIKGKMSEPERKTLAKLREAIMFVLETHGLGYGRYIYRKTVEREINHREITLEKNKIVDVDFDGEVIRSYPMRFWLIENQLLCDVVALQDSILPEHAVRIQTFLKYLNLSTGLIVNFGKHQLELQGVHYS